jgi:hypothetical protein
MSSWHDTSTGASLSLPYHVSFILVALLLPAESEKSYLNRYEARVPTTALQHLAYKSEYIQILFLTL